MNDRELLELAAKAAGIDWRDWTPTLLSDGAEVRDWPYSWNPLDDDSDALALAARLRMNVDMWMPGRVEASVLIDDRRISGESRGGDDLCAAARRAIVRCAAAIAEDTK